MSRYRYICNRQISANNISKPIYLSDHNYYHFRGGHVFCMFVCLFVYLTKAWVKQDPIKFWSRTTSQSEALIAFQLNSMIHLRVDSSSQLKRAAFVGRACEWSKRGSDLVTTKQGVRKTNVIFWLSHSGYILRHHKHVNISTQHCRKLRRCPNFCKCRWSASHMHRPTALYSFMANRTEAKKGQWQQKPNYLNVYRHEWPGLLILAFPWTPKKRYAQCSLCQQCTCPLQKIQEGRRLKL